jgi:hypothetical protein
MKFEFTKDQIERLLETYNVKDIDKLLNEDIATSIMSKFLGKRIAAKLEANYGDDAIKVLDNLFAAIESRPGNIIKGADKKLYLVSGSRKQWSMDVIKKTIDGVASGKLPVSDLKYLPNTLKDGTNFRSVFQNQFKYGRPKPITPTPNTSPNTTKDLTYGGEFLKGMKTVQAPFLASRYAFRNVPIPGIRAYIRKNTTKLTSDEMNRIRLWFFTGVGDAKSIYDIFKKHKLPLAFVYAGSNLGGQLLSKWLFWSAAFSITNLLLDVSKDIGKPVYESELEGWVSRIKRSPEGASLGWLFPVMIVYKQLIAPLGTGGIIPFHTKQFNDKLIELNNRAENERIKLESMTKNGVKKSKSIITPKPKNTTNQPKVDTTSQNVKTDNESQPTNNQSTARDNRPVIKY